MAARWDIEQVARPDLSFVARPALDLTRQSSAPALKFQYRIEQIEKFRASLTAPDPVKAERQAARAGALALWRQNGELNAVRNGRVYIGTSNALLVPGPRSVEAAQRLFDYIHGTGNQS